MALLEARGLAKTFGRRRVVSGVDLEVQEREIVGLLGPNGAGKTTCFRMICGLLEPNEGACSWETRKSRTGPCIGVAATGTWAIWPRNRACSAN